MASHLTVTSATQTGTSIRAFGSAQAGDASASGSQTGVMGLFSALLGGSSSDAKVSNSSQQNLDLSLLGLANISLDGEEGGAADQEAIAAALDLNLGALPPAAPGPLVDLIDAMAAIKVNLSNGGEVDPVLLENLNTAMQALAETLGIDLDADVSAPKFADLLGKIYGADTGTTSLLGALDIDVALRAGIEAAGERLSPQLQATADRLAALLGQMGSGEVDADLMAKLGLVNGQVVDAEVEAALTRLSNGVALDAGLVPQEPDLAAPSLKVTEPALTGKEADANRVATVSPAEGGETETGSKDQKAAAQAPASTEAKPEEPARASDRTIGEAPQRDTRPAAPAPAEDAGIDPAAPQTSAQTSLRVDAAAPRVVQAGYQTSQQQLNLPQIAFELARQVTDGNTRFQIRLDPPELGRIDVRLDIDKAGQVNARLVVEKAETLDLMQRDQRGLERALQQAGIDSGKTNLEFSLKQNPFAGQNAGQDQRGDERQMAGRSDVDAEGVEEAPAPTVNLYRRALQARGVNIIA